MNNIISFLAVIMGFCMNAVYKICKNYGISLIVFTIVSKIILFPLNMIIQKNSIKMVKMKPEIEKLKLKYNNKEEFMNAQIELFDREKYNSFIGILPLLIQIPIILGLIRVINMPTAYIQNLENLYFLGMDLSIIPSINKYVIIPILALISTIMLCLFQNKLNVLQREETFLSKLLTGIITTIITVYFVLLVPTGVGLYWIYGNILGIIQLYILNWIIPPKKYINYNEIELLRKNKKEEYKRKKIEDKKSKEYYKKFFETENINNMKLIFYSEQSGFYKYFKGMIEYILNNSNITIHYITSDINDKIFEMKNPRIVPYFIVTNQLIPLFMKIEADIVVMTTPDLGNFYLKRSIVRKDVEYIFTDHGLGSQNLLYRQNALDYYDTIFAKNYKQEEEIKKIEEIRNVKKKKIVQTGYSMIDDMILEYEKVKELKNDKITILIAPSWQEDNIMDSCIDNILDKLLSDDYRIIVRPHPQYIKRNKQKIENWILKYKDKINENFIIEQDFSSNETIYTADLVITDWSGIGYEFSFSTTKPCLFINTDMKILNPDYKEIDTVPMDIEVRNIVGKSIEKDEINNIKNIVDELIKNQSLYMEKNKQNREKYIFNIGKAAEIEGKYIIDKIRNK